MGFFKSLVIIIMLVLIGAMIAMLHKNNFNNSSRTIGIDSPQISHTNKNQELFDDGLGKPSSMIYGTLDEFGEGVESTAEFYKDINNDGTPDTITKKHIATGNDHDYYEYKIELNVNGVMVNITPSGMRTTHGADCALRLIKFKFKPKFEIIIISRPFQDTWDTPSLATEYLYQLNQNQIVNTSRKNLVQICDVTELF